MTSCVLADEVIPSGSHVSRLLNARNKPDDGTVLHPLMP
ncbi:Hypothetical protein ETEE_3810 [Edwardsiella anguillarum ET080813]|uniref:Uncharacterized protein n=1 Tax=Edwardsiella anguillarum ET080813 TaxID=667120 RepID=A0A076LU46_9GAMM|nr:Hypothetical protein ETEE_3810 [Edwardsiella anguillarum ET080813]